MAGKTDQGGVIIPPRRGGHQDSGALQEAIRAEIKSKQAAGIHLDVDLGREVEMELRDLAVRCGVDPQLTDQLLSDGNDWNVDPAYRISSHRNGVSFLIIWLKKMIRPFVRLYTDYLVRRQAQLNIYLFRAVRVLVRDLALQRRDQLDQRYKSSALEREIHRLRERLRREGIDLDPELLPGEDGPPADGGA